jgi:hypothetical protein
MEKSLISLTTNAFLLDKRESFFGFVTIFSSWPKLLPQFFKCIFDRNRASAFPLIYNDNDWNTICHTLILEFSFPKAIV